MTFLRVLYWEDAYIRQGDFGQKCFTIYLKFHFRLEIDLHCFFMPLEILKFSIILATFSTLFFSLLRLLKVCMSPLRAKNWILNTRIWSTEHSYRVNNGVGNSFGLPLLAVKKQKFRFFDFRHLMSHRGRRYHISENFFEQKIALGLSFRLSHHVALAPLSCEKKNHYSRKKPFFAKIFNFRMPWFQNLPLVERSHIYERMQLGEYYQNIIVTHLDHFWN